MKINGISRQTLWEIQDGIEVIDQRLLPHQLQTVQIRTAEEAIVAIKSMTVRGAPLIGAVGAYAVYLMFKNGGGTVENLNKIVNARPTAVNLKWAAEFVWKQQRCSDDKVAVSLQAARQVVSDELDRSRKIGQFGLELIKDFKKSPVNILTHCNAGWLAAIDYGTALAPVYAAHDAGIPVHVWVDETRPRNQGAALTAYELGCHGVPYTVIADNAGGHLMQSGEVDMVIVGADRVANNGDTANKIGTYLKALAARESKVPFYVAIPSSTIDVKTTSGKDIAIEERPAWEVAYAFGLNPDGEPTSVLLTPKGAPVRNPAFDITPAELITGFITETGVFWTDKMTEMTESFNW